MSFDTKQELEFDPPIASSGGLPQKVVLRWPTDEEWAARQRGRKIIIRRLGRGISETVPPEPGEADLKLYSAIAVNGAPVMTPAEAAKVIEVMAVADVFDVQVEGGEATVEMEVASGRVKHHMRIPTADEVLSFRRAAASVLDLPFNQQEIRVTPEAGARLYEKCQGKSEDYVNGIPNIHKDAAARAVIEFIDRALGPRQDDANF